MDSVSPRETADVQADWTAARVRSEPREAYSEMKAAPDARRATKTSRRAAACIERATRACGKKSRRTDVNAAEHMTRDVRKRMRRWRRPSGVDESAARRDAGCDEDMPMPRKRNASVADQRSSAASACRTTNGLRCRGDAGDAVMLERGCGGQGFASVASNGSA